MNAKCIDFPNMDFSQNQFHFYSFRKVLTSLVSECTRVRRNCRLGEKKSTVRFVHQCNSVWIYRQIICKTFSIFTVCAKVSFIITL